MWWLQALILGGLYQVNKHPFSMVLLAMVNSSFGFFFSTSLKSYPIYNGFLKKGVCKCLNLTSVSVSFSFHSSKPTHFIYLWGLVYILKTGYCGLALS